MTDEEAFDRLLSDFREKAEALGVVVFRVASTRDAAAAVAEWASSLEAHRVVVASEALERVPELAAALSVAGTSVLPPASPEAARDIPLGVSLARLAIAETGSMLLSEPALADRAVSMLTLSHVILCPSQRLLASLDDAAPELRTLALAPGANISTLVTGPSRTADIERVLTVGVQGPGRIMILFVDQL